MVAELHRVLLLNGVVLDADAISRNLMLKHEIFTQAYGGRIQVDVAAHAITGSIPNAHRVDGLVDLMSLEAFHRADLIIYEFGIYYDLFGSIRFAPDSARTMAIWHNVTPPELATSSQGRVLMERSLAQTSNMLHSDRVLCDSRFNADALSGLGFDEARVSVLNLPVSSRLLRLGVKPCRRPADPLRVLFVGRFVQSKGAIDLVRAIGQAVRRVACHVELSLVGNTALSDPGYLALLHAEIAASAAPVRFCGTLDEAALALAFHTADIFVMPSYHEGYCLPALEAFAAGCHVIAYDAGNLPAIVGLHGCIVPTGEVGALADALADCFAEDRDARSDHGQPSYLTGHGRSPEPARRRDVRRYAARFSEAVYAEGLLMEVERLFDSSPQDGISDLTCAFPSS